MRQGTESETRPPFTEQPKHLNLTHGNYTNDWLCLVLGDNLRFFSLGRSWRRLFFFSFFFIGRFPFFRVPKADLSFFISALSFISFFFSLLIFFPFFDISVLTVTVVLFPLSVCPESS